MGNLVQSRFAQEVGLVNDDFAGAENVRFLTHGIGLFSVTIDRYGVLAGKESMSGVEINYPVRKDPRQCPSHC